MDQQQPAQSVQNQQTVQAQPVTPVQTPAPAQTPAAAAAGSNDNKKKQLLVLSSVLAITLFLIASMFYILGAMNKTKRLGMYVTKPAATSQQQTAQPEVSAEEKAVDAVDTGDPTADLNTVNQDYNAISN